MAALAQAQAPHRGRHLHSRRGDLALSEPPEVPSDQLLIFGVIGLVANIIAILILAGGRDSSLNMSAGFLEVLNDALGSLGVIAAAIVIQVTGFQQADALMGLFIAALIVPRAVRIMVDTLRILMDYTPKGVDLDEVRERIVALEHVEDVHGLSASAIGSNLPIISAHVAVGEECFESVHALRILEEVQVCVSTHLPVAFEHATIQLESPSVRQREAGKTLHT
nr:cation diffusion facilitator family transporter [Brachybacterium sp. ACRRE]